MELGENLTGQAMERAFEAFTGRINPGSAALIYFSGFGIQAGRRTYLIPVNAQIWNEADVRRFGVNLEPLLAEIAARGAGANSSSSTRRGEIRSSAASAACPPGWRPSMLPLRR